MIGDECFVAERKYTTGTSATQTTGYRQFEGRPASNGGCQAGGGAGWWGGTGTNGNGFNSCNSASGGSGYVADHDQIVHGYSVMQGSVDDIPSLQIDWTKAGLGYQRDIAMKNAEGWVEVEGIPIEGSIKLGDACTIDNTDWHSNNDIQNAGTSTSRLVASKNEITSPYLAWVGEKYMTETYQHTLANGDVILGNMESSIGSGNKIFDTKVQGTWGCTEGAEDMCSSGAWIDCRTSDNCAGRRFVYSMPGKKVNIKKFSLAMAGGHDEGTRTGGCSSVKVYYWNDATSRFKNVDPSSISCNLGNGQNQVYQRSYEITMPSVGTSALGFEFEPDTSRNEPNYILQEMTIDGCIIGI